MHWKTAVDTFSFICLQEVQATRTRGVPRLDVDIELATGHNKKVKDSMLKRLSLLACRVCRYQNRRSMGQYGRTYVL